MESSAAYGVPGGIAFEPAEKIGLGGIEFQELSIEIAVYTGGKPAENATYETEGCVVYGGTTGTSQELGVINLSSP